MLYLLRTKKIKLVVSLSVFFLIFSITNVQAQKVMYLETHDQKPYYFGISLGTNITRFHIEHHSQFLQQDSIMVAEPLNSKGFALGLLATGRLSNRFLVRFNPQLMFTDRSIFYKLKYQDIERQTEVEKKVESVMLTFPLQLKFQSDRIGNFRVYMMGGGKFDLDLASNAKARKADDMIKIGRGDYGVEAGLGFNFYFPSFILSPEIKISNGLNDMHSRDEKLNYSNVLDRIQSRMIMFSIHIEG
jgi:hypothetical protein